MKLQKSTNIHIILLSAQSCFIYFMQYFKFSTFMNFLRRNAKAAAKCSRPCENIIRSFVNGGADVELARSQPA